MYEYNANPDSATQILLWATQEQAKPESTINDIQICSSAIREMQQGLPQMLINRIIGNTHELVPHCVLAAAHVTVPTVNLCSASFSQNNPVGGRKGGLLLLKQHLYFLIFCQR